MQATVSVRLDGTLKKRGDAVLKRHDISATEAVRMLWQELAQTRRLPSFIEKAQGQSEGKKAKLAALDRLSSFPSTSWSAHDDEALRACVYESLLKDYEALS